MKLRAILPVVLSVLAAAPALAQTRPNVIVILVDDMGYSDIGCYGGEIPTPHLDKLAAGGLRFTQFYNTGRCCPTRAALLTGVYSHQAGVGHMTDDKGLPGYSGRLSAACPTIAEVMRSAGYFTAMAGKWHVGQNLDPDVIPSKRGFDRSLNAPAGGFYYPGSPRAKLYLNGAELPAGSPETGSAWYSTDLWTDFSIRFIDDALGAKKPFFLYLAHNAPHFPLQAPAEEIAKFRGKYRQGWDALRLARHERQVQQGLVDAAWPIAPRPDAVKAWDACTEEEKGRFDHIMAIYAATVAHMDASIGRLTAALQERGVLENTLILFMSDNGGNAESGPDGKLTGANPGDVDSTVFCGESWALMENTPFRRYKHYNHEGGIATPLIAHWPSGIAARGELRQQPGHVIDIMATCVDVAGAEWPVEQNGQPALPMEGRSLRPAFANQPIERDALFWEHEGNAAVRVGDWKLVRAGARGAWELYNLKADRTEQRDLSAEKPDKVADLSALWIQWAKRADVLPAPAQGRKGQQKNNKQKRKAGVQ